MKKLLLVQNFKPSDKELIIDRLKSLYEIIFPESFDEECLLKYIDKVDSCLGSNLSHKLISSSNKGLFFQLVGTGVDKLNLIEMSKQGIILCNSYSHSIYVAEFAISLLFSLIKKIHIHDRFMREGRWWRPLGVHEDSLYLSDTLINRKVGFLGFGHIGQNIAKMIKGFDVDILAYNRSHKIVVEGCPPVNYMSKEKVIEESDIIFITLPLTETTRESIGFENFKKAKTKSLWVHISRGAVVSEVELYKALKNNEIAGIAIDNWFNTPHIEGELKFPSSIPFHKCENVLLSPYRAIYVDGISPHLYDAIENLTNFALGKVLKNKIKF